MSDSSFPAASPTACAPAMVTASFGGPGAWTRSSLPETAWRIAIGGDCLRELADVAATLRRHPLDTLLLTDGSFDLPACRALMARVKTRLDAGALFAVLDRLPLGELTPDEARQLYWLLCSLLSRPVAQRFDGTMTFDVLDRKIEVVPGSGVRPTVTNVDLTFHNDNSYNAPQPDYIALLCLGTPLSGGTSKVASVYSVHNALLAGHREVLPRLYRPFFYDRYREHAPGESGVAERPVFVAREASLETRIAIPEIVAGYKLAGQSLDAETQAALDALRSVFAEPETSAEFQLERGQIQFVNNRLALHSRGHFVDSADATQRRHLVRLWLRDRGSRSYTGQGAA